jgi:hypothetical protein
MGHASRSNGLLHDEASQARIFLSGLKTGGGAAWMVHITSLWRLRLAEAEAKDGLVDAMRYIGLFYPNFTIFHVLGLGAF